VFEISYKNINEAMDEVGYSDVKVCQRYLDNNRNIASGIQKQIQQGDNELKAQHTFLRASGCTDLSPFFCMFESYL
jgi:hypothetical protein